MSLKNKLLRELGFLLISCLLVTLSWLLAGTFFQIWIKDLKLLALMSIIFYLIIGFYRFLNRMARKYRDDSEIQE